METKLITLHINSTTPCIATWAEGIPPSTITLVRTSRSLPFHSRRWFLYLQSSSTQRTYSASARFCLHPMFDISGWMPDIEQDEIGRMISGSKPEKFHSCVARYPSNPVENSIILLTEGTCKITVRISALFSQSSIVSNSSFLCLLFRILAQSRRTE